MGYRVKFTHRAEKDFAVLPDKARIRIEIALEKYAAYPFHRQDVKKVKGCPPDKPLYRIRIGEYRAIFRIIRDQLVILCCSRRKKEKF